MSNDQKIPLPPLLIGLAGLIPFSALSVAVFLQMDMPAGMPDAPTALATYAAIIISFLGGIRWGVAINNQRGNPQYVVSIVPALVAWGLLAAPEPWRLTGLGIVALALGPLDFPLVGMGLFPVWFGRLRLILSGGAGLSLLIAASRAT